MKRIKFKEENGEMCKEEESVFPYCDCINEKLQIVPTDTDEEEMHTCQFCGSYVLWSNHDEISSNGRR
jgi:hypothetical protein